MVECWAAYIIRIIFWCWSIVMSLWNSARTIYIEAIRSKKLFRHIVQSETTARNGNVEDTVSSVSSINSMIAMRPSSCVLFFNNKNSNKPIQCVMRILRNLYMCITLEVSQHSEGILQRKSTWLLCNSYRTHFMQSKF